MELSITGNAWLDTLLSAAVAIAAVLIAWSIGWRIARRLARHLPLVSSVLQRVRRPARGVLIFLALQFVWQSSPDGLHGIDAVRHGTAIGLIGALTWFAMRFIGAIVAVVEQLHNPTKVKDNLQARRLQTQVLVIGRIVNVFLLMIGLSCALITFPSVRQIGTSLLASAGMAGLVAGLAARPVLGNLIAGIQIALTQPIRYDDVLIVDGEWGRVEEITSSFVVVRIWDQRRLVVPLQWFIENPFQNWTRTSSELMGTVFLWVDYGMPIEPLRQELQRLVKTCKEWDGRFANLQVVDTSEKSMQLRALVTSADSGTGWDLRCKVREGLLEFMRREYPQYLPRFRAELAEDARSASAPRGQALAAPRGEATLQQG